MTRRRIRDAIVGVVLLVVVWMFYTAIAKEEKQRTGVDRVVYQVSQPLERAFVAVFKSWMGVWRKYLYRVDLKKENARLEQENAALAANNHYLAAVAKRGRLLYWFRAYMADSAAEMLPANVVRRRIDTEKFRVIGIVIDRKHTDVGCGAPVVTPQGVVGRVLYYELDGTDRISCPVAQQLKKRRYRRRYRRLGRKPRIGRAMVQLTVDAASRIDVRVPRTGARGILRGLGWDKGFVARISHLDAKTKVAAGDLVVTSGVDGRFPAGLPVGRILSVKRTPGDEPLVLVRPPMDFGKLTRVLVVISPPPPTVPRVRRAQLSRLGLGPYP
jgi:rod shape-determining protein MreC